MSRFILGHIQPPKPPVSKLETPPYSSDKVAAKPDKTATKQPVDLPVTPPPPKDKDSTPA